MNDVFWLNNFMVLFDKRYVLEIWPGKRTKTKESKYNAMSRFVIIYSILVSIYHQTITPIMIAILVLVFVVMLFNKNTKRKPKEPNDFITLSDQDPFPNSFEPGQCRNSTPNNLFANPNINVIGSVIIPSCKQKSSDYDKGFSKMTNVENDDIFNQNSRRQFYSVIDNNQSKFANFLYEK